MSGGDIKLVGACGIYCGSCDVYVAHRTDDLEKKAKIAEDISKQFGKEIKPEQIICDGCNGEDSLCWGKNCLVRVCVKEKGVTACFECNEYPCKKLKELGWAKLNELEEMKRLGISQWLAAKSKT